MFSTILGVSCFSTSFLFLGFLSLEPTGLSRFKRLIDSLVSSAPSISFGILIRVGIFAADICNLVIVLFANALGN